MPNGWSTQNTPLKCIRIYRHAVNKDWEDLAVGPCGQTDPRYCIYIHDGGNSNHGTPTIYKIEEPSEIKSQTLAIMSTMHYR